MKVYYKEFEDLADLNEWLIGIKKENIISLQYSNHLHCLYFWM